MYANSQTHIQWCTRFCELLYWLKKQLTTHRRCTKFCKLFYWLKKQSQTHMHKRWCTNHLSIYTKWSHLSHLYHYLVSFAGDPYKVLQHFTFFIKVPFMSKYCIGVHVLKVYLVIFNLTERSPFCTLNKERQFFSSNYSSHKILKQ